LNRTMGFPTPFHHALQLRLCLGVHASPRPPRSKWHRRPEPAVTLGVRPSTRLGWMPGAAPRRDVPLRARAEQHMRVVNDAPPKVALMGNVRTCAMLRPRRRDGCLWVPLLAIAALAAPPLQMDDVMLRVSEHCACMFWIGLSCARKHAPPTPIWFPR
jgi:hypothetical protein